MRRGLVLSALFTLLASACAGNTPGPPKLVVQTVDLGADRYRITAPTTVAAGIVQVEFTNRGKIPHDAQLYRVDDGHTQSELVDTIGSERAGVPDWVHAEGGVGTLTGGRSATAMLHLVPGTYYITDTGVDEDDIAFAKAGAIRALTVTGTSDGLPQTSASVVAREYAFDIPPLRAGAMTVRFQNVGAQTHELLAAPLLPGKTLADVMQSLSVQGQSQGPSPIDLSKAVSASRIDPGRSLVTTLHLEAGRYAFVCLLSDRRGGPPHVALGMIAEVTVA